MFSPFGKAAERAIVAVVAVGAASLALYGLAVLYLLFLVEREATGVLLAAAGLAALGYGFGACFLRRDHARPTALLTTLAVQLVEIVRAPSHVLHPVQAHTGRDPAFALGLWLRIVAVFAFPALSDDVYRFLWDGGLWWAGLSPYGTSPEVLADTALGAAFAKTHDALLVAMNSPSYATVYPPLSQVVFAVGGWIRDPYWGSVAIKAVLLIAEIGVWHTLGKLLTNQPSARYLRLLYWLNPLVIVEAVGNAHFEGLALLFVLLCLRGLQRAYATVATDLPIELPREPRLGQVALAGLSLAAAALVKLVPLVLAPAIALALLWRRHTRLHPPVTSARAKPPRPDGLRRPLTLEEQYIMAGEWPYAHEYEVVPPSPEELEHMRAYVRLATDANPYRLPGDEDRPAHIYPDQLVERAGARGWDWRAGLCFGVSLLLPFALVMALALLGGGVTGFGESLDLYFRNFEFNGSLYSLGRALGQWYKGWNWIAVVGPGLSLLGAFSIVGISAYRTWRNRDLATTLLLSVAVYLACATTVHPWYFIYLVGLATLTPYRWPLLLSCTAFLSYAAYAKTDVAVPAWALLLEYVPVVAFGLYELYRQTRRRRRFAAVRQ